MANCLRVSPKQSLMLINPHFTMPQNRYTNHTAGSVGSRDFVSVQMSAYPPHTSQGPSYAGQGYDASKALSNDDEDMHTLQTIQPQMSEDNHRRGPVTRTEQKQHQGKMSGRNIYKSSKYNMGRVGGTHTHRGSPPLQMSEMAPFGKVRKQNA
jgi:hypothetical protein